MKTTQLVSIGLAVSSLSLVVGCGGGAEYTFVSRAQPTAFARPQCHAIVEPLRQDKLTVDGVPEAAFLAKKKPNQIVTFERDKRESEAAFVSQIRENQSTVLAPGSANDTFVIRPTWTAWEVGGFTMFSNPGTARILVDVLSPEGKLLDRLSLEAGTKAYTAEARMKSDFVDLGKGVSRYMAENWSCAAH
jgi:hypothetical protein